ncbi:ABC transporter permease [Sporosarcina sp. Te-1]|uniref:ABC transporter permease n=1 Tax=Sporosarcina sp. Te-1 TaxID=2818390 RepID=UPI001A9F2344|nr:ABC transporter permease [Sporosarcina sp. Te-1]QTD42840.1 ABC transporter permease [Sporosarcina sp. Te-1]
MRDFWIIFKQAFVTKAKAKSFIITTAIMVAAIFIFANIGSIIDGVKNVTGDDKSANELNVIDNSDVLFPLLKAEMEADDHSLTLVQSDRTVAELEKEVEEGDIDSFVTLDLNEANTIQAKYMTKSVIDFDLPSQLQEALQSIQTQMNAQQLSLTGEQVQSLFSPIQFEQKNVSPSAKSEEELMQASILVYVLMFVIYMSVIMYSSMIAMEVATEKSSRVMEILISSVSPVKHMFAKVFGIGTLGIVQIIIYGLAGYIAFNTAKANETGGFLDMLNLSNMNVATLVYAVVFFLLGYFLYATLAALLGSLVSRTEDVQQMIMPMSLLIVVAFLISMAGLSNPELSFVTYASYVPFFTPLVMFLRVGMLNLPLWEPLLAIGIMLVTLFLLGWFGARVYRGGVLMYGPSRSLKDIKKAVQLGKE